MVESVNMTIITNNLIVVASIRGAYLESAELPVRVLESVCVEKFPWPTGPAVFELQLAAEALLVGFRVGD